MRLYRNLCHLSVTQKHLLDLRKTRRPYKNLLVSYGVRLSVYLPVSLLIQNISQIGLVNFRRS